MKQHVLTVGEVEDFARFYRSMGIKVIPVGKRRSPNEPIDAATALSTPQMELLLYDPQSCKVPLVKWNHLQTQRQTQEEFDALDWLPSTGIAGVKGDTDLIAFDFDDCKSREVIEEFIRKLQLPPEYTWVVKTHRGYHIWVQYRGGLPECFQGKKVWAFKGRDGVAKQIELRISGITLLPGSMHPSGELYEFWRSELPIEPPATVAWEDIISALEEVAVLPRVNGQRSGRKGKVPVDRFTLQMLWQYFPFTEYFEHVLPGCEIQTESNGQLRFKRQGGLIIDPERKIWYCHLHGIGGGILEAIAYFKYANIECLEDVAIVNEVLAIAAEFCGVSVDELSSSTMPAVFNADGEVNIDNLLWYTGKGELGDALLFRKLYEGSLLYNLEKKRWLKYDSGRWSDIGTEVVTTMVAPAIQDIYNKALYEFNKTFEKNGTDEKPKEEAKEKRNILWERMKKFNKISRSSTILNYAAGLMRTTTDEFDSNRFYLNFTNGTLEVETGLFREHRAEDMITVQLPYEYDPAATCPEWHRFLQLIFKGNQELIEFVQKSVSLSLTGNNDIERLYFNFGAGANGKSTFFNVVQMVLSGYYATVNINSLIDTGRGGNNYDIARLPGKRFVSTTEVPEGISLKEEEVKSITSGDRLVVRQIYQSPFEFTPQFMLWVVGNFLPVVRGADLGIWRRILLIPFEVTIPEDERIPKTTIMKIFGQEIAGIMNWMLEGHSKFREDGLAIPKIVQKATEEFKEESNILLPYIEQHCQKGAGFTVTSQQLWKDYTEWCESNMESIFIKTSRSLNNRLRALGYVIEKGSGNATIVRGLKLKPAGLR